jgi:hypothetical protein
MLSGVLSSYIAIAVNIEIIRVFTKMRNLIHSNTEVLLKIEQLEKNMMKQNNQVEQNTEDIQTIPGIKSSLK